MDSKERFESKFRVTPGCWIWEAGKSSFGYGRFRIGAVSSEAHRLSYKFYVGDIPEGLCVLHRCDNPACVNPDHFFLGTRADNNADKKAKGRTGERRGENGGRAKLTTEQVVAIYADPRAQVEIAAAYGVKQPRISAIKQKKTWRHVWG